MAENTVTEKIENLSLEEKEPQEEKKYSNSRECFN